MKSSSVIAFLGLLIVPFTFAQSLAGLPACADTCALNAIGGSGCPLTNSTCICSSPTFLSSFETCFTKSCNATDQAAAAAFGVKYCAAAGVTLTIGATAPVTASATSSSAVPTVTAATTTAPATTAAVTTAATTTSSALATFTGAAALLGHSWVLVGIGAAAALGL